MMLLQNNNKLRTVLKPFIGFSLFGLLCAFAGYFLQGSRDSQQVIIERPVITSVTVTPTIPEALEFCDSTLTLSRYNMHEGLDRELSSFCYFHSTTMLYFKRANQIFPIIEPILKEYGIPDDFKYLAMIESNLDPRSVSPARAVGLWQFMPATAKQYGLIIAPTVDERSNIEKSTVAACKYLKDAYDKFGDWVSVAASYNAGMGRISRELKRQNVDSALDLWLVEETRRYVYRIMAIKLVFENPYKYGFVFKPESFYRFIDCKEVTVSNDIANLVDFANEHGVTYADIKRFNPWITDTKLSTAGRTFTLKIPKKDALYYKGDNTVVHHEHWVVK